MKSLCECCNKNPSAAVASSFLPISFAYCASCLHLGYEPYGACVSRVMGVTPIGETLTPEMISNDMGILDTIKRSLEFHGKTWEEFAKDVREADEEYDKAMMEHFDDMNPK